MDDPKRESEQAASKLKKIPHEEDENSMSADPTMASSEFEELLSSYDQVSTAQEGDVMRGTVLRISGNDVVIDVGFKSEGIVSREQFLDSQGRLTVKPGDVVDVLLERTEDGEGHVVLSRERAERMQMWDFVEEAYEKQTIVQGVILDRVKGGVSVDVRAPVGRGTVRAFLPGSQIDLKPVKNLDAIRGMEIQCKVIKTNKKRGNIVLSRKLVLEEDVTRRRAQAFETLQEGHVVTGTVKNITDYGVFVDLGGLDGLLHVSDTAWGRPPLPHERFSVGDSVTVKVLKFDREKQRVSLGLKQLQPDPWLQFVEQCPVGTHVRGRVTNIMDYGAFVEVAESVEGLIHVSEMSWSKRVKHPSKIVNIGDEVEAVVLAVQVEDRKLALGLKQIGPDPWAMLAEKYPPGSVIQGRVRNLTDFGAFVEIEDGIDGLIHVSDMSWTKRVKHPSEMLKKGDVTQAVVLNIDVVSHRVSLGLKQLQTNVWEDFFGRYQVGDVVRGRVTRVTSFGAFVSLMEGIEGLCHRSECFAPVGRPKEKERETVPQDTSEGAPTARGAVELQVGQEYDFKIIKMNFEEKKIGLSQKALHEDEERRTVDTYQMQTAAASRASLGDFLARSLSETSTKKTEN